MFYLHQPFHLITAPINNLVNCIKAIGRYYDKQEQKNRKTFITKYI